MSSPTEVVRYLLRTSLLDERQILEGDLRIDEVSRRNLSYRIQSRHGPCYFVKQGLGVDGRRFVAREGAIYRRLCSPDVPNDLRLALPRFYAYEEADGLLVLGLSPGSSSLQEFHARRGRIPKTVASATGRALAGLHRVPAPTPTDTPGPTARPAWPLSLHRPDVRLLRNASGASLEMVRMIQEFPDFCRLLEDLRGEWNPTALIHFDWKADNCVIAQDAERPREYRLQMVDWEAAGPGDPCWDVGSVFGDYLGLWLVTIPVLPDTPPARFIGLTRFPLDRMAPAIRAFWSEYAAAAGLDAQERHAVLLRSMRYSAARLLQAAYERMQTSPRVTGNVVCMLQLAWNILERPDEAAASLMGLAV
ncbi:MAG: phosphotransferase family protein [Bacteroidota bacterium]